MAKKKKMSKFSSNYVEFFSLCQSFVDAQIEEDFESMGNLAQMLMDHPIDEATKARVLKKNDISIYDLEEAINFTSNVEEEEDCCLAASLEQVEEIFSYNRD